MTFEEYVAARRAALVLFAALLTGDDHRAQDLVQEALAKAYLNWRRIRRIDQPDVYVRRLLVNANRSWWRRRSSYEMRTYQGGGTPPPGGCEVPSLPVADGVPGPGNRSDLVGADPGILHFDLDAVAAGASQVAWSAGSGHETADISRDGTRLRLDLGRDLAQLDSLSRIGGLAEIFGHGVASSGGPTAGSSPVGQPPWTDFQPHWTRPDSTRARCGCCAGNPSDGCGPGWRTRGAAKNATWFAATVQDSLGSARRCVAPGQLRRLPVGLRWTGCGVILNGDNPEFPWAESALVLAKADGTQVQLRLTGNAPIDPGEANATVAGHPARWTSKGDLIVRDIGGGVGLEIHSALGRFTEPEAIELTEAVRVSGDRKRPDSWPVPAVH